MTCDSRPVPIVFALAVALVLAVSLPVGAEDAVASSSADGVVPDAASTPGAAGHVADEILVTARKREENVQDVPVAVTVLSGEVLEERAAADLSEIQADVPNLSISASRNQSGSRTTFLRGVGQAEPLWGVDPGVGLYLDGVYIARAQGALLDILDVERIEVLRGPQGTLYGKNTIGGAIRYLSRPLTDDLRSSAALTAGGQGTAELRASIGGSLVPNKLRAELTFASFERDGYGSNLLTGRDVSNKDVTAFRLALDWLASEEVTVSLRYDLTDDDSEPAGLTRLEANPLCPAFGVSCEPLPERFDTEAGLEPLNGTLSTGVSLDINWAVSPRWRMRSITAWRDADTLNYQDFDGSAARIVEAGSDYQDQQFSQEVQFAYRGEGRLQGVLGVYYFNGFAGGRIRQWLFGTSNTLITGEVHTDSIALFGDGSYALSDRLTLNAGVRVTEEQKRGVSFNATYIEDTFDTLSGVVSDFDREADFSSVAPRLGLDYELSDRVMTYLSLSRGFKGGGFNVRAQEQAFPESAEPYDDEVLTMVEAGVKSMLADRSLMLNAAVFYGDYDDVQVGTFTSFDADGDGEDESFFGSFLNAGNATIRGVEVEYDWTVNALDWLRLSGHVSYLDAAPDDFIDRNGDGFVDTQVITNAPEWTSTLHLHLDFPAWGGLLTGRLSWAYRDDSTLTSEGGPDPRDPTGPLLPLVQPAFDLFGAGVSWTSGDGAWQVSVAGKNLGDETYLLSGYNVPILGVVSGNYGAPRTVSTTLSYRF